VSKFMEWLSGISLGVAASVLAAGAVIGGLAGVFSSQHLIAPPQNTEASASAPQTEAAFIALHGSDAGSDVLAEWREVRGDHKIIAYAIAYCKPFRALVGDLDTMPRTIFSALMLDLTPIGEHSFATGALAASRDTQARPASSKSPPPSAAPEAREATVPVSTASKGILELSGYQQTMLYLSDAIGRARLSAAAEASNNYPRMTWFGWVTIGISAIATLLVTIKASMTPPSAEARRMNFVFVAVGLLAMTLSALGTALTSAKQFYDPTRAYRTSKAALLELQRLHKQVSLEFAGTLNTDTCAGGNEDSYQARLKSWSGTLGDLQAAVIMASANLQDADVAQLKAVVNNRPPPAFDKGDGRTVGARAPADSASTSSQ